MKYRVNEVEEDGAHAVDIPDGWLPLFASRGIGRWKIVCLEPMGPASTLPSAVIDEIEQELGAAPEVYVSKKDRERMAREAAAEEPDVTFPDETGIEGRE